MSRRADDNSRHVIQNAEADELAYSVLRNVELQSIRLIRCEATAKREPGDLAEPFGADIDVPVGSYRCIEHQTLQTVAHFRMRNVVSAGSARTLCEITLEFSVEYALLHEYRPPEDQLKAFAQAFAVFNAWPYAREMFQNLIGRMGECAPPLPLLRFYEPTSTAACAIPPKPSTVGNRAGSA